MIIPYEFWPGDNFWDRRMWQPHHNPYQEYHIPIYRARPTESFQQQRPRTPSPRAMNRTRNLNFQVPIYRTRQMDDLHQQQKEPRTSMASSTGRGHELRLPIHRSCQLDNGYRQQRASTPTAKSQTQATRKEETSYKSNNAEASSDDLSHQDEYRDQMSNLVDGQPEIEEECYRSQCHSSNAAYESEAGDMSLNDRSTEDVNEAKQATYDQVEDKSDGIGVALETQDESLATTEEHQQECELANSTETSEVEAKFETLSRISDEAKDIASRIDTFQGSRQHKEYLYIEEMLTRCLLQLDAVSTDGNLNVRKIRKDVATLIHDKLKILEGIAENYR